jgi:hypothetical protein
MSRRLTAPRRSPPHRGGGINLFGPPPPSLFPVASSGAGSGAMEFGGHHPLLGHIVMKHGGHKDLAKLASLTRIKSETGARAMFAVDSLPHHPPVAALPPRRECVGPPPPPPPRGPGNVPPCDRAGGGNRPAPSHARCATQRGAPRQTQCGGTSRRSELGRRQSRCRLRMAARDQPRSRLTMGGGGRGGRGR